MEIFNVGQKEKLSPAQGRSQSFCKEGFLVYMACSIDNGAPVALFTRGSGASSLCKFLNFRISEKAFCLF